MNLFLGDCLEVLQGLEEDSVDLVLTDPPYGKTACEWDAVIPIERMWAEVRRVAKKSAAVVLTASQPFPSDLIAGNRRNFRYDLVWEKTTATGHLNAKKMPMRAHEDILVFYESLPTYNPQKTRGHERKSSKAKNREETASAVYGSQTSGDSYDSTERYPRSVVKTSTDKQKSKLHPTQKPESLMRWLVETYTNPGDRVLDFAMGSGTTGVACVQTGRDFVGVEKEPGFFKIAKDRIEVEGLLQ